MSLDEFSHFGGNIAGLVVSLTHCHPAKAGAGVPVWGVAVVAPVRVQSGILDLGTKHLPT